MPGPDPDPDRDLCPLCGFPLANGLPYDECPNCHDAPHPGDCNCRECDPVRAYRLGDKHED